MPGRANRGRTFTELAPQGYREQTSRLLGGHVRGVAEWPWHGGHS